MKKHDNPVECANRSPCGEPRVYAQKVHSFSWAICALSAAKGMDFYMQRLNRILYLMLSIVLFLTILAGCKNSADTQSAGSLRYTSFRDIPDLTEEEINTIETLQAAGDSFIYGMTPSAETFTNELNEIRGYSALLCEWLTELFDIAFIPVYYTWGDLLDGLKSGDVDFTGELALTDEHREIYYMSDAIAERSLKYFRIDTDSPLSEISEERRLRFAILKDTATIDIVNAALEENTFDIILVDDADAVYSMLKSGEADAYINESPEISIFDSYSDVIAEDFYPIIYNPVSLSTQNPTLQPIISIVQKALQSGGSHYLTELYDLGHQEYMRYKLFLELSDDERAFIRDNPIIPLAAEYDNYPVSFYNKHEKQWQGVAFDVLHEVEDLTGLTFQLVNDERTDWPVLQKMLEDGEASVISELIHTRAREGLYIWPENTILTEYPALLTKLDYPDVNGSEVFFAKVGLLKGTAHTDFFHRCFPYHANTIEYDSMNAAVNAMERGEIDMVMATDILLLTLTNYNERPGYKANLVFDKPYQSTFGFNKNCYVLCSIVDKALRFVDTDGLSGQWMRKNYDYRLKVSDARRPWLIGAFVLFLCVIILLSAMFANKRREGKRLEDLVQKRTAELESITNNYKGIIWSVDTNGIVTTFKGQHAKLIAVEDEIEGERLESAQNRILQQTGMHFDFAVGIQKTLREGPQDWMNDINGKIYHTFTTPICDNQGGILGIVGSTDDVTEPVKLQQALGIQTAMLETYFQSAPELIACKDLKLNFIRCNKQFEEHFGCCEADIIGTESYGPSMPAEMLERIHEAEIKVIRRQKVIVIDGQIPSIYGTKPYFEIVVAPLIRNGVVFGVMDMARDITERKKEKNTIKE